MPPATKKASKPAKNASFHHANTVTDLKSEKKKAQEEEKKRKAREEEERRLAEEAAAAEAERLRQEEEARLQEEAEREEAEKLAKKKAAAAKKKRQNRGSEALRRSVRDADDDGRPKSPLPKPFELPLQTYVWLRERVAFSEIRAVPKIDPESLAKSASSGGKTKPKAKLGIQATEVGAQQLVGGFPIQKLVQMYAPRHMAEGCVSAYGEQKKHLEELRERQRKDPLALQSIPPYHMASEQGGLPARISPRGNFTANTSLKSRVIHWTAVCRMLSEVPGVFCTAQHPFVSETELMEIEESFDHLNAVRDEEALFSTVSEMGLYNSCQKELSAHELHEAGLSKRDIDELHHSASLSNTVSYYQQAPPPPPPQQQASQHNSFNMDAEGEGAQQQHNSSSLPQDQLIPHHPPQPLSQHPHHHPQHNSAQRNHHQEDHQLDSTTGGESTAALTTVGSRLEALPLWARAIVVHKDTAILTYFLEKLHNIVKITDRSPLKALHELEKSHHAPVGRDLQRSPTRSALKERKSIYDIASTPSPQKQGKGKDKTSHSNPLYKSADKSLSGGGSSSKRHTAVPPLFKHSAWNKLVQEEANRIRHEQEETERQQRAQEEEERLLTEREEEAQQQQQQLYGGSPLPMLAPTPMTNLQSVQSVTSINGNSQQSSPLFVKKKRQMVECNIQTEQPTAASYMELLAILKKEDEEQKLAEERNKAAVKIQSIERQRQAKKKVKERKALIAEERAANESGSAATSPVPQQGLGEEGPSKSSTPSRPEHATPHPPASGENKKESSPKKIKAEGKEREEEPLSEEQAATKIQALQRQKLAKKEAEKRKKEKQDADKKKATPLSEEQAATKIQSIQRKNNAKKEVAKLKAEKQQETAAPTATPSSQRKEAEAEEKNAEKEKKEPTFVTSE